MSSCWTFLWRCAWRTLRRSRENLAFWRWLVAYRRRSLPAVMGAIADHASHAELHLLQNPHAIEQLLSRAIITTPPDSARETMARVQAQLDASGEVFLDERSAEIEP